MKYILIHGLGQKFSSWNETISYMVNKQNAICPDLSSYINDENKTYLSLYNKFSKYCDSNLEPLNLCGLSLGAVLALNYAIDNPTKVQSLVLIAGQYRMSKVLLRLQNIVFRFIPEKSFESIGMDRKGFIELTNSMMNLNFNQELKKVSCPVLLICGEKDIVNIKATKKLAEIMPESEMFFVKNAKHEVNIDNPKELAEIINDFYSRRLPIEMDLL
ncbi:alpha/beta hydrolase [Clostridium sp. AL.422]|uniref:alpha/beta fold hydrolase n=1 Tax=Clostridium TaxID=1485 RepID=UPI00293DF36A|nr:MULTISPECIES: alpha/beta hydrolase [unclassified Clostridium]MDV4150981.1 alpha/beta hydrolase [Clostridium sp. AL.422]